MELNGYAKLGKSGDGVSGRETAMEGQAGVESAEDGLEEI
jgi:hypothetical protein